MPRIPNETKQEIIKQLHEGISLNKISRQFGLYKSTHYYYYKKVKGKKFKEPLFTPASTETEGEIVGIFAGDGSQYFEPKKYGYEVNVHFGGHNHHYAYAVKELFEGFFHKKFILRPESQNRLRLRPQSKKIYHYFHHYLDFKPSLKHATVNLHSMDLPHPFKIGFIRGLIDTDGHIAHSIGRRKRIFFYTTSSELAANISSILSELKLVHGVHKVIRPHTGFKPLYTINIWKNSVDRFINIVRPRKFRLKWAGS